MLFDHSALLRQLRALVYKNFLITVIRRPAGFLFSTYVFPISILWFLIALPSLLSSPLRNGVSSPASVKSLAETVQDRLIIVQPDNLGPDVSRVIDAFTESIPRDKVVFTNTESNLESLCSTSLTGRSECHGAVVFVDSPLTPNKEGDGSSGKAWRYTIRADPALDERSFDATSHHGAQEDVYLPLQVAIDRAITNSTTQPEVFRFTEETQSEATRADLQNRVEIVSQVYAFALFAAYYLTIYRLTRFVTGERESGMSQLLDAMGGPMSPVSRVLSWLLVIDVLSIPCFIILGAIYSHMLFPTSSMGVVILWQVLLGLAVNSSTVFAASFFKTSRTSAIYVMGVFLLLSIITSSYSQNLDPKPQFGGALFLSLFFASSSHIFFVQQLSLWEVLGSAVDLNTLPPSDPGLGLEYGVNPAMLLGFLGLQIIVYPCATILVEILMHGISNRRRTFPTESTSSTQHPFEANDLHKKFYPGLMKRIFCCGRKGVVKALDGVSFQGQQGQITCLLGPNGSGKTTTLHMMSGFLIPSSGSINLGVQWSQMGVCPQRDTFWEQLSVMEHIKIWSQIKSAKSLPPQELDQLVEDCDLGWKRTSKASTLSGGQKRKLQLACMFVGDSKLCLIDECTSGLDPLSRQAVWKILLQQRSRRSIVLTTHFLDEVEILADDIVIMSKGKIKCQGPCAELTARYGSGYTVAAPVNAPRAPADGIPYSVHQDQVLYKTADSNSAARLCTALSAAGVAGLSVSSPSIEDVFMRVVDDVDGDLRQTINTSGDSEFEMTPATRIGFGRQVLVILGKRFIILKHFWWPYFYALVITLAVTPQLQATLMDYTQPPCKLVKTPMGPAETPALSWDASCATSGCDHLTLGPSAANSTLFDLVRAGDQAFTSIGADAATAFTVVQDDRSAFIDYIKKNVDENLGGVYLPSDDSQPLIGYRQRVGSSTAGVLANLWSQMASGVDIIMSRGTFGTTARPEGSTIGMIYVMFFTFVQAIYPAVFSLYPAMERSRKVRALEYANGVRRGPIWVAYGLFDFMWVLLISAGVTLFLGILDVNGSLGAHFCVLSLYGLTGVFTGYIISHFTSGPLKAFITTFALSVVLYAISLLALAFGARDADATQHDATSMGLAFGLNLIFPIGNVMRALFIGLNIFQFACSGDEITSTGSIYSLGGPILYLILQSISLLLVLINLENNKLGFFWRRRRPNRSILAQTGHAPSPEVKQEQMRVKGSPDDLLQVLHVSKSFGALNAVDDVCFGLPRNDILALLGPNGAGKSTLVGMLSSQLVPDGGSIILCGDDARSAEAQRNLGVCPQHDAIDLMTTMEHLLFYARVKGVRDPKRNTKCIMAKLGLSPHKNTMAAKLSGGNKRKLSLAIALMGMPSVLILDEPTTAMDALAKRAFWSIVRGVAQDRSILLTTHSMEEADALATRTAIMKRRFLAIGTTEELRQKYSDTCHINLLLASAPGSTQQEMEDVRSSIAAMVPGTELERDMAGGQIRLMVLGTESMGWLIGLLEDNKDRLGIAYSTVTNSTLENVFASVIKESTANEDDEAAGLHGDGIPLKPLPSTTARSVE